MTSPLKGSRRAAFALAFLFAASLTTTAIRGQDTAPDPAVYRTLFEKAVELYEPTGFAMAVVQGDEVVFEAGQGALEVGSNGAIDEQSLFNVASCTKAFTASLVGLCVQRGLCAWDDPVIQHMPEFRMADPWITQHLTVRDLLCHRSGLVTFAGDLLWYGSDRNDAEVLRAVEKLPITNRFREEYGYQNLMFLAAGQLAAKLMGKPWEQCLREELLGPLGMTGSGTHHADIPENAALALPHIGGERTRLITFNACRPAASIWSSAHDMTAWLRFNLAGGKVGERTILEPATLTELWKPHTVLNRGVPAPYDTANFRSYGLGWFLYLDGDKKVVEHGGGMPGYLSKVTMVPADGFGFVLLNNGMHSVLNEALRRALLAARSGGDGVAILERFVPFVQRFADREKAAVAAREATRREGTSPSRPLADYAGSYSDDLLGEATLELRSTGLHLQVERSKDSLHGTLSHWHDDTFRVDFPDRFLPFALIRFELGFDGAVTGFTIDCPIADFDFGSLDFRRQKD